MVINMHDCLNLMKMYHYWDKEPLFEMLSSVNLIDEALLVKHLTVLYFLYLTKRTNKQDSLNFSV